MEHPKKILPCPKIVRGQTALTPEQAGYARQFAQERITAMFSTAAIDEYAAEEHLHTAYRVAGLDPVPVRWFDSPIPFCKANVGMSDGFNGCLRENIWDGVEYERVQQSIWDNVEKNVRESVQASVEQSVRASVRREARIDINIVESIRTSTGNSFGVSDWDSIIAYCCEDKYSFYRFFHEVFEENDLIHLVRFNEMVSGYRTVLNEALVVRKPVRLERDEQGRLHSENGMCLQYRDGWGFYAWHGVRCSEQIILHPEQMTRNDWLNERDLETRRIIQERLGPERFIALAGGTCIDHGERSELIAVDLHGDPERVAHYIHVQDSSTERQHYLRVPPTLQSADEAVAWTFRLNGQEYQPNRKRNR